MTGGTASRGATLTPPTRGWMGSLGTMPKSLCQLPWNGRLARKRWWPHQALSWGIAQLSAKLALSSSHLAEPDGETVSPRREATLGHGALPRIRPLMPVGVVAACIAQTAATSHTDGAQGIFTPARFRLILLSVGKARDGMVSDRFTPVQ